MGSGTGSVELPVSAVVPARDAGALDRVLDAILGGRHVPREVIVVDDRSRTAVRERPRVRVVRTPGLGRGPARNLGASAATSERVWFVDADVVVGVDTLGLLWEALESGVHGAMAVYRDAGGRGYGRFRQDYHRYQVILNPRPRHLSAACLLIRTSDLDALGGFPDLESLEDVALGMAGAARGFRWCSVTAALVTHLDRGRLLALLARDHHDRGVAAATLCRRMGVVLEHAASPRDLAAAVASLALLGTFAMGAAPPLRPTAIVLAPALLAVWVAADAPFLRFVRDRRGVVAAATSLAWLLVFRISVGSGVLRGLPSTWRR